MLARFLMIAAVMFVVTACSSTDDETALGTEGIVSDQPMGAGGAAGGPLMSMLRQRPARNRIWPRMSAMPFSLVMTVMT
jgi:hypothetical protein